MTCLTLIFFSFLLPFLTIRCNSILHPGAVSFGQIVKAGEPVFAAATNAILLGVSKSI